MTFEKGPLSHLPWNPLFFPFPTKHSLPSPSFYGFPFPPKVFPLLLDKPLPAICTGYLKQREREAEEMQKKAQMVALHEQGRHLLLQATYIDLAMAARTGLFDKT